MPLPAVALLASCVAKERLHCFLGLTHSCSCLRFYRVAIQEAERWNVLLSEMRRGLAELDLGLKGDLTMTEPMASDFTEPQAALPLMTSSATGHKHSALCKLVPC